MYRPNLHRLSVGSPTIPFQQHDEHVNSEDLSRTPPIVASQQGSHASATTLESASSAVTGACAPSNNQFAFRNKYYDLSQLLLEEIEDLLTNHPPGDITEEQYAEVGLLPAAARSAPTSPLPVSPDPREKQEASSVFDSSSAHLAFPEASVRQNDRRVPASSAPSSNRNLTNLYQPSIERSAPPRTPQQLRDKTRSLETVVYAADHSVPADHPSSRSVDLPAVVGGSTGLAKLIENEAMETASFPFPKMDDPDLTEPPYDPRLRISVEPTGNTRRQESPSPEIAQPDILREGMTRGPLAQEPTVSSQLDIPETLLRKCLREIDVYADKIYDIVLQEIQKDQSERATATTIRDKVQAIYRQFAETPDPSRPDGQGILDVVFGLTGKTSSDPRSKAATMVDRIDHLYATAHWHLRGSFEVQENPGAETSDSGMGTSIPPSSQADARRKRTKTRSNASRSTSPKRQRQHSTSSDPSLAPGQARSEANSSRSRGTQSIKRRYRCYSDGCKRKDNPWITTWVGFKKHFRTHMPTVAVICPFVHDSGVACKDVFESEHYRSNLKTHLRTTHNVDLNNLKFARFETYMKDYMTPKNLIQIRDRFHTKCLFCNAPFDDRKKSQDHILEHQENGWTEQLDAEHAIHRHDCGDTRCGTEKYWKSSQQIAEREANRTLTWPRTQSTMHASPTQYRSDALRPVRFSGGYNSTSHGALQAREGGSSVYPPIPDQLSYGQVSHVHLDMLALHTDIGDDARRPLGRWVRQPFKEDPYNNMGIITDRFAQLSVFAYGASAVEALPRVPWRPSERSPQVRRAEDEEKCSTDSEDGSSNG